MTTEDEQKGGTANKENPRNRSFEGCCASAILRLDT